MDATHGDMAHKEKMAWIKDVDIDTCIYSPQFLGCHSICAKTDEREDGHVMNCRKF
jgi:hypothetical protein